MASDCMFLNRRDAIFFGASVFLTQSRVFAQGIDSYERLVPLISGANSLIDFSASVDLRYMHDLIPKYVDWDFRSRIDTLRAAGDSDAFTNSESAVSYVRAIPSLLPGNSFIKFDSATTASQIFVIEELNRLSLPIIPPVEAVSPAIIPSAPDHSASRDSDVKVLIDIFLETCGIYIGREEISVSLIEGDEKLNQTFLELMDKVSTKDWKDVAGLAEAAFKLFVGGKIWKELASRLEKKAVKNITFGLAVRCVPVVGWIYLVAALLVSIKKNYYRFSFAG